MNRASKNGVPLESVTEEESRSIEPRVKTYQRALFSPTTSSVDPKELVASLLADAIQEGVQVKSNSRYVKRQVNVPLKLPMVFMKQNT